MSPKRKVVRVAGKGKTETAAFCTNRFRSLQVDENITSSSQNDATPVAPISKLNDDCLREIFSHLSKRQLIGIERVCKKWKEVALSLWSRVPSLNYDNIIEITQDFERFDIAHFKSILKRCKKHLIQLHLDHSEFYHPRESDANAIIFFICMKLKNLKHFRLSGGLVTKKGLSLLEKQLACLPNLESFSMSRCEYLNDKILEGFLKKAPKLKSLDLFENSHLTGSGLANSTRAFKELSISFCYGISVSNLIKVLKNSPELEVLKGVNCTFGMLNVLTLRESLIQIETIYSNFFQDVPEDALPFFKLRIFRITRDDSISNKILSQFKKWFPNLESIKFTGYHSHVEEDPIVFNNDGVKELAKLPNLKLFDFLSLRFLSGEALVYLAANTNGRIEIMECAYCNNLSDSEMIKFVSLCPKLTYLNVSYCRGITGDFLEGILNSLHLRTSKKPLKIRITDSEQCDVSKYEKKHSLLVLEAFSELENSSSVENSSSDKYYGTDDESEYDSFTEYYSGRRYS